MAARVQAMQEGEPVSSAVQLPVTVERDREILEQLTEGQYRGWACAWCHEELDAEAKEVRRLQVYQGVHWVGTILYACSACLKAARTKRG